MLPSSYHTSRVAWARSHQGIGYRSTSSRGKSQAIRVRQIALIPAGGCGLGWTGEVVTTTSWDESRVGPFPAIRRTTARNRGPAQSLADLVPTRYLLDTNILSDLLKNPQGEVAQKISSLSSEELVLFATSIIVAAKLR
jgi:hypothetical protein